MNKKGFTLVELIAVIVLLALVTMLIVPNLSDLRSSNSNKQYETYLNMMMEYTKLYPNYKNRSTICLSELKTVGLKNFSESATCNGYVTISGGTIKPYISCTESDESLYKSEGYSLPSSCG